MTKQKKQVTEWLNEIDYSVDADYLPSDFALEFITFIKLVNGGEGEENKSPVVHLKMLDNIAGGKNDTVNLCHRGLGKTAVLAEYLFLYLAVYGAIPGFGKVPLSIYVSDSIENGVKNMRKNLEHRWNNSEFLMKYVTRIKFTDVRWEFENIEGNILIVKGYGAQTGVRGAKELGMRPVLAILDDLISDDDARSKTVIAAVEDTVYKAVDYALHPHKKKTIWSGTPFNAKDPLYKAVESGGWYVNVYPVCETFPCSKEDFKGSWPDRFTYEYVKAQYDKAVATGKIDTFNQEMMLRIMSDEDRLVLDNDIQWYNWNMIKSRPDLYNFYITTDFAVSDSEGADYSVISVWALDNNSNWFWVDGVCRRQDMSLNIDWLFKFVAKYKPQSVGIEVSGQQGGFITWVKQEMLRRNVMFALASESNNGKPGIKPVGNKLTRFNTVVPWFKLGRMFLPERKSFPDDSLDNLTRMLECIDEAVNELTLVSPTGFKSKHDDWSDTVSMLSVMNAFPPGETGDMVQKYDTEGVTIWDAHEEPVVESPMSRYF